MHPPPVEEEITGYLHIESMRAQELVGPTFVAQALGVNDPRPLAGSVTVFMVVPSVLRLSIITPGHPWR